ncbi:MULTISPECIES: hypothetical protein [Acinetobacter]|uniref:hypothetical protein n=1 Tax=Acinetobacter TaxID=469 RepID=UPI00148ED734|nr:hypothetical protein [Acinetobacter haemolyticus]
MSEENKKPLPADVSKKLSEIIKELEESEGLERSEGGEIELKINKDEALWFVSYKTMSA